MADKPGLLPREAAKNLSLMLLSICFLPIDTCFLLVCLVFSNVSQIIHGGRYASFSEPKQAHRYTVLVTGVGMTKGLAIARAFYQGGHRVIGADFEPWGAPVCGRFSRSLSKFYRLRTPSSQKGSVPYVETLLDIIARENVDLWVSCSGVASAVEDGEAKEIIEARTRCKAIQFDIQTTKILHEKHTFIEHTQKLGLNVPQTHNITGKHQLERALRNAPEGRRYIMKTVGVVDALRADMTLLPKSNREETLNHIARLPISDEIPWILQEYIEGEEYCTHAIVVRGQVKAFVACPSAELLMHYQALPCDQPLFQAMLSYTELYSAAMGPSFTGHCSFDFMVRASDTGNKEGVVLYPIECNPRAHTAVILFNGTPDMVDAYLSYIDARQLPKIVTPKRQNGYYWIGHDLITKVTLPTLGLLAMRTPVRTLLGEYLSFVTHLLTWRDGTFEIWDPLPWWWLYHVYWPMQFWACISHGRAWSRVNVSTTKMFER